MPCVIIAGYDQLTIWCQVRHISQVWYVSHSIESVVTKQDAEELKLASGLTVTA